MKHAVTLLAWTASIAAHAVLLGLLPGIAASSAEPPIPIEIAFVEYPSTSTAPLSPAAAASEPPRPPPRSAPAKHAVAKPRPVPQDPPLAEPSPGGANALGDPPLGTDSPGYEERASGTSSNDGAASEGGPIAAGKAAHPPVLIHKETPEYPASARRAGITGEVVLAVVLAADGMLEETIEVRRSVAALDQAAIRAVRRWRFQPATDDSGRALRVALEIPFRFVLR